MDIEAQYISNQDKYHLVIVEKCVPPQGIDTGNWHRYVIGEGKSRIVGFKCGTLHAVTDHAHAMVNDLNTRATRGGSFYAPRYRKK